MTGKAPRVALIGGTGRTGGWVLEALLNERKEEVSTIKVLARSPDKLSQYQDKITVVTGSATESSDLKELLKDTDVVISTIGSPSKEKLVVKATAEALVEALQDSSSIPRIIWMTATGVNEATAQAKMYTFWGGASDWLCGYGGFGLVVFKILIPFVIGQTLWDDMGKSELVIRNKEEILTRTVIARPTNMHPVSEHPTFSDEWKKEGGENLGYIFSAAEDPPPGKWMNKRAIAAALCDLIKDTSRDGTAVSLFQDGDP